MTMALTLRHRAPTAARILARAYSTPAPPRAVSDWIQDLTSREPVWSQDVIDLQRVLQLHKTLPTRSKASPLQLTQSVKSGDALPCSHHLILFQPQTALDDVGADGSSTEYNPPAPYLRRMWAGGSFEWSPDVTLKVGEDVTESTKVAKVEFKKDMVFVYQEKRLYPGLVDGSVEDGWAVKETRTHVFRTTHVAKTVVRGRLRLRVLGRLLTTGSTAGAQEAAVADLDFAYTPTSPLLFRYSALTFNGHKIHYDRDWVRDVEGHPDLVVHGPLTATLLVEVAAKLAQDSGKRLARLDYRATGPMYVDREIKLSASEQDGKLSLSAVQEARTGMKATALIH